jgi:hypothetical protein
MGTEGWCPVLTPVLLLALLLSLFLPATQQEVHAQLVPSPFHYSGAWDTPDDLVIVGIHPFNWVERNLERFFKEVAPSLHIQFLDRATGFMESWTWRDPYINTAMIRMAKEMGIQLATNLILTPIPPPASVTTYWELPDGSTRDAVRACGGRDLEGRLVYHGDGTHLTFSLSCPGWFNHLTNSVYKILDRGVDHVDIDNIIVSPFVFGGDFSPWTLSRFREHLLSKKSDLLAKLGIDDVHSFNITEYVSPRVHVPSRGILLIVDPRMPFREPEIEALTSFVEGGGALFVQAESMSVDILNKLLTRFGLMLIKADILSLNPLWDVGSFETRVLNQSHPITRGIESITLNWAVPVVDLAGRSVAIVQTGADTWLDLNHNWVKDPDEPNGPFNVMVATVYGRGRVVVMGDRSQDAGAFYSHRLLIEKALRWLVGGEVKDGMELVLDRSKHEWATTFPDIAEKIAPDPLWVLYTGFKQLAESLGFKFVESGEPPLFPDDPMLREFVKFQHLEHVAFIKSLSENIKKYVRERYGRDVFVFGNLWIGGSPPHLFDGTAILATTLSPYLDIIQIEGGYPTFPPVVRYALMYRMGHAMAEFRKPVWQHIAFYGREWLDKKVDYTKVMLIALEVASAYANGAVKELDLAGWPGECLVGFTPGCGGKLVGGVVVYPDMTVPGEVKRLTDFIWGNRYLLTGYKPFAKIAIVYSIPSFLWRWYPALGIHPYKSQQELAGVADMLQFLNIPYDILIFGHPELYSDTFHLNRLMSYDAIILPAITHISDNQLRAIQNYLKSGGKVILTGGYPVYDEENNPLPKTVAEEIRKLLSNNGTNVLHLRERIGETWYGNMLSEYREMARFQHILKEFRKSVESFTGPPPVRLENYQGIVEAGILRKGGTYVVHIINYNYNVASDSFRQLRGVKLYLDSRTFGLPQKVTWLTPEEGPAILTPSLEGSYMVLELPDIHYWGLVVINPPEIKTATTTKTHTALHTTTHTEYSTQTIPLTIETTTTKIMTTTTTDTITRTENAATAYLPIIYTVTAAVALAYIINRWTRPRRQQARGVPG